MNRTVVYYLVGTYIAVIQAFVLGLIVSLIDSELGLIMAGVVLGWQLTGLIYSKLRK